MKISFVTSLVGSLTVFVFGSTLTSETVKAGNWNVGGSGSTFVKPENYVVVPQTDPGGKAVKYGNSAFTTGMPENARPNDATISLYQNGRKVFLIAKNLKVISIQLRRREMKSHLSLRQIQRAKF